MVRENMKYNDYPIPDEELVNVLKTKYKNSVNTLNVNAESQELKDKLSELYVYLSAQNEALTGLKRLNKNLKIKFKTENHLKLLEDMGVNVSTIKINSNYKSCFFDYLKTEVEILKLLMAVLLIDGVNFNRCKFEQMLNEQLEIFSDVAYF
jgi:hypothetical protein